MSKKTSKWTQATLSVSLGAIIKYPGAHTHTHYSELACSSVLNICCSPFFVIRYTHARLSRVSRFSSFSSWFFLNSGICSFGRGLPVRRSTLSLLLYFIRCRAFFLLLLLQMAAWAAIIILTAESDNLASGLAQQLQSVAWISQAAAVISTSIVPATVTIINAIMPIIIKVGVGLQAACPSSWNKHFARDPDESTLLMIVRFLSFVLFRFFLLRCVLLCCVVQSGLVS